MTENVMYEVAVECPVCSKLTRFIETTLEPVPLDEDVGLRYGKTHCPFCGVDMGEVRGGWDLNEEYEIDRVTPTQECDDK